MTATTYRRRFRPPKESPCRDCADPTPPAYMEQGLCPACYARVFYGYVPGWQAPPCDHLLQGKGMPATNEGLCQICVAQGV